MLRIDEETEARARIEANAKRPESKGGRPPRFLLSGILRCGHCGGPLKVIDGKQGKDRIKVHVCSNYHAGKRVDLRQSPDITVAFAHSEPSPRCTNPLRRPVELVDAAVLEWVRANLGEDIILDVLKEVRRRLGTRVDKSKNEVAPLEKEIATTRAEVDRLVAALAATDDKPDAIVKPGAAALLAIEPRDDGTQHAHGLVLCEQGVNLLPTWQHLTGGLGWANKITAVTGWRDHVAGLHSTLVGNVAHIINYAFKPWPPAFGGRDLGAVVTSGPFVGAWRDTLAALNVPSAPPSTSPTCPRCEAPLPAGREWCKEAHRKAAYNQRRRLGIPADPATQWSVTVVRAFIRRFHRRPFNFEQAEG